MNYNTIQLFVNLKTKEYCKIITKIPTIEKFVVIQSNNHWVEFRVEGLYKQKYILYVKSDFQKQAGIYVEQMLFHEFTHMVDSLQYLDYEFNKFKKIWVLVYRMLVKYLPNEFRERGILPC